MRRESWAGSSPQSEEDLQGGVGKREGPASQYLYDYPVGGSSSINDSQSRLTVTLQVTPEEARRIAVAEKEGKLQLVVAALESAK
jgi:hypothetical protein